jgi:lysophospholipase L1-like esterase
MANEQYVGFLPYGSNDPSVILADPLTTKAGLTASVAAAGGTLSEEGAAVSDFDSVKGFRPQGAPGNGSRGYQITLLTRQAELSQGGQLTFEIESKYFTLLDSAVLSDGYDTSTGRSQPPYCLSIMSDGIKWHMIGVERGTTAKVPILTDGTNKATTNMIPFTSRRISPVGEVSAGAAYSNSMSYSEWVTVNLYWYLDGIEIMIVLAIDGEIIMKRLSTHGEGADVWDRIYLGNGATLGSDYTNDVAWMRNFQISSRQPAFGRKEVVGRTAFWSDSLFANGTLNQRTLRYYYGKYTSNSVDSVASRTFGDAESGVLMGDTWLRADGGYGILSASQHRDKLPDIIAKNPDMVVFMSGVNDSVSADLGDWETEYKFIISSLFAGGIRGVVACTVPSVRYAVGRDTAANVAQVAGYNAIINALPDWDSRVLAADVFNAMEGETGSANFWRGGFTGASDDLHWHEKGSQAAGEAIVSALKKKVTN